MATLDGLTKISPEMDSEAQRWVEAANIPRLDLGPAFANVTIRRGAPTHCRTKQHVLASTPKMLKPARLGLPAPEQTDLPTTGDRNAFDDSFAHALNASLVTKRSTSHTAPSATIHYDGPADDTDEQTPLLASDDLEESRPRSDSLQPLSKIKPSLSICLWNEVCYTSQYTRPVTEILREVLEVRYPAPKPSG